MKIWKKRQVFPGKFFNLKSLRTRLILMCLMLLIVPSITIGAISYRLAKQELDISGKIQLKNSVRLAIAMIDAVNLEVKKGSLDREEAQEIVKQQLLGPKKDGKRPINKKYDLGANGYFMVYDLNYTLLAHPNLEGKNSWDSKDPDGFYFARDYIEKAKNGGGFTYYKYQLPNKPDVIAPKIVYSEMDPNWGWVICAGSYMQDYNSGADKILNLLYVTLGISIVMGAIVLLLFARRITRPINMLTENVKRVAANDLTVQPLSIKNKDEIGQLAQGFNTMVGNLKEIVRQVTFNSQQVAAAAEQLAASAEQGNRATEQISYVIQEVAEGAERQVRSVDDASHAVNEMSNNVQQIADNSGRVSATAVQASEMSLEGRKAIETVARQMKLITGSVGELSQVVKDLGERSKEIGKILEVISGIAGQTNLLALNAAIEAARAGEHGRGFAVVADEVRKLAEQSAESAQQIADIINAIQNDTVKAVETMESTSEKVAEGIGAVDSAGDLFEKIRQLVTEVTNQIQNVNAAVQQLSEGTGGIVNSVRVISEVSESTASGTQNVSAATEEQLAAMQEIAASSASLSKMAEELQTLTGKFKM